MPAAAYVVVGGGFTAMDCMRTSVRQGAKEVTLVYRRDMKDMPAASEVHEGIEEGARAIFQAGPDAGHRSTPGTRSPGVEFIRMQPGAPDASGRRRPRPAKGTEFIVKCDRVLLAIGQGRTSSGSGPATRASKLIATGSRQTRSRSRPGRPGVFGTGDVRIGAATVVQAIAEGRRCAYAVDAFLKGGDLSELRSRETLTEFEPAFLSIVPFTNEPKESRHRLTSMPAKERSKSYIEYEIPTRRTEGHGRIHALPAVHLRSDRQLRPAGVGHPSTRQRSKPCDPATTWARASGA